MRIYIVFDNTNEIVAATYYYSEREHDDLARSVFCEEKNISVSEFEDQYSIEEHNGISLKAML